MSYTVESVHVGRLKTLETGLKEAEKEHDAALEAVETAERRRGVSLQRLEAWRTLLTAERVRTLNDVGR